MSLRRNNFKLAYRSLQAAKGRSSLTMFGIVIGVMAVVLVVCIGQGVKAQISGQLGRYAKHVLIIQPDSGQNGASLLGGLSGTSSGLLTQTDLKQVKNVSGIQSAVPLATASGSMTGDHTVTTPFIIATTTDFTSVFDQSFASGGFFDTYSQYKSVVLGQSVARKLFDDNAPLGQGLIWRGQRFVVAGVFNDFHAPPFSLEADFNNAVFVPLASAQKLTSSVLGIYQILAKVSSTSDLNQTGNSLRSTLYASHGGAHDVSVKDASKGNAASDQAIHQLTLLIAGAAIIALIVGGVGIMNVMLVSVTERMHEIGIRKAIGATNRQVMRQFVAEAFVLSTIGAVLGVILAAAAVGLLRLFSSVQAILVWQIMLAAPLTAIAIGLCFGSLPALKAARKDPIEALRNQ